MISRWVITVISRCCGSYLSQDFSSRILKKLSMSEYYIYQVMPVPIVRKVAFTLDDADPHLLIF